MATSEVTRVSNKDSLIIKKKRSLKNLGDGRIRNVRFVRNWNIMDGKRLGTSANTFLSKLLFREASSLINEAKRLSLDKDRRSITGPIVNAVVRMRLSSKLRNDFDEFYHERAPLLREDDEEEKDNSKAKKSKKTKKA